MRNLFRVLPAVAMLAWASVASAQLPGGGGIVINQTPVSGGSNGQCLFISNGKISSQACGGGTITAGSTVTSGVTSGNLLGSTGNLVVDSGVPFANVFNASSLSSGTVPFARLPTPATLQSGVSVIGSPAATASTTGVMAGIGSICAITPAFSTRVAFEIHGNYRVNTAAATATIGPRFGTGIAPVAGAPATGTAVSTPLQNDVPTGSVGNFLAFAVAGTLTGLTTGTAIWLDLDFLTSTAANTAQLNTLSCSAHEF